jgi:hypothetical protein
MMLPIHWRRIMRLPAVKSGTVRVTMEMDGFCVSYSDGARCVWQLINYNAAHESDYPVTLFRRAIRTITKPRLEDVA